MNGHLAPEEIARWAAGDRRARFADHVAICSTCASELKSIDETLGAFRQSVRHWSALQFCGGAETAIPRNSGSLPWRMPHVAWALTVVALCAVSAFLHQQPRPTPVETGTRISDVALLNRVDIELSRSVPSSLAPLVPNE